MLVSVIKKINRELIIAALISTALVFTCFKTAPDETQLIFWSNNCFFECYDASQEANLKTWDLKVTFDLFLRMRKTYLNGKQEYYSFKLKSFDDVNFVAVTPTTGTLKLKTGTDNIIYQTYNDPKGDVDDMADVLSIPVKDMNPQRLDSLKSALLFLKNEKQ